MDESAIKQIQDTARAASNIKGTQFPAIALPKDMQVHSLEKYDLCRHRFRGQYNTSSIDAFCDYIDMIRKDPTSTDEVARSIPCFVDPESMSARAIFDLGTVRAPGHAEHASTLKLKQTAPYAALLEFAANTHTQQDIAEFIEDWQFCIKVVDSSRNTMDISAAVAAVRCITIEIARKAETKVATFSESRSALETIDANSSDKPLPAWIHFECEPFRGISSRTFSMRISLRTARDTVGFRAQIQNHELAIEEMAKEFSGLLGDNLEGIALQFIGTYDAR